MPAKGETAASPANLGLRPQGDTEIQPDLSQVSPDLKAVYDHIDANFDQHVMNLQRWIQQPSISNTGEGIPESAQMVKGLFDELGCEQTQVYEVGETDAHVEVSRRLADPPARQLHVDAAFRAAAERGAGHGGGAHANKPLPPRPRLFRFTSSVSSRSLDMPAHVHEKIPSRQIARPASAKPPASSPKRSSNSPLKTVGNKVPKNVV